VTSLLGLRVVVTRPPDQSATLVEHLRAAGAIVITLPTVTIAPPHDPAALDAALARLDTYDWLVLTSPNGAAALGPRRRRAAPLLGAVGPATAQALVRLGWPKPWTPRRPTGQALAAQLPIHPGERVLLLRSDLADPILPRAIEARGVHVEDVVAYRTVPRTEPLGDPPDADAYIVMSPSALDGLLNALAGDASALDGKAIVAAGPTTAAYARARGLRPIEADHPTPEAILDALAAVPA
jgi:uroporphyrinogen-III synthase